MDETAPAVAVAQPIVQHEDNTRMDSQLVALAQLVAHQEVLALSVVWDNHDALTEPMYDNDPEKSTFVERTENHEMSDV